MDPVAEQLAGSLLYEGYALYPYTPGNAKNATPTPFGIVYPPAYAERQAATLSALKVEVIAAAPPAAELEAELLFLQPSGARHQGTRRRVELGPLAISELAEAPAESAFAFEPGGEDDLTGSDRRAEAPILTGSVRLTAEPAAAGGGWLVRFEVNNTTPVPGSELDEMERPEALLRSMISAHVLIGLSEGRFASPLERDGELGAAVAGCENLNTWPVLASPEDDVVMGAAYFLPDHPQVAPESKVDFFDNTEIEEALVLHMRALSDSEREEISRQDPKVREMLERADSATDSELAALHGRVEIRDADGEEEVAVAGRSFRRGEKVVLEPAEDDPYDKMLAGRVATIGRLLVDYDGKVHIGVTVDSDPLNEVLGDSGRFLYFFADEIRAVEEVEV